MRVDKYLKVSRVIKRRTVAQEACDKGRVTINGVVAKPCKELKIDDIVQVSFGNNIVKFRVKSLVPIIKKDEASNMYEMIQDSKENL